MNGGEAGDAASHWDANTMLELQSMTPVRESLIWSLLHDFYQTGGPEVWKEKVVPQGSTANCYTADTYAGIAAAFLRDLQRAGDTRRPLIIELGGGSGRFAWQFMNRLRHYHFADGEPCPEFTYMLTDAAPANVRNWATKKRFRGLVDKGLLEFGELLVEPSPKIKTAGGTLTPADIRSRPTIIIANYLFDCIPSDLIRIKDHEIRQVLVAIESEDPDFLKKPLTSFKSLKEKFSSVPIAGDPTAHPLINRILRDYAGLEGDFHMPVPEQGFRFLESFLDRDAPLMMLAGDLAYSDPDEFHLGSPFIFDGYFAHYTNFHMFAELFRANGGFAQFQRQKDANFSCGAFILPTSGEDPAAGAFHETRRVAAASLREFNPFDAHELIELINDTVEEASFRQIFAWLRFSRFDPVAAEACLPIVFELLEQGEEYPDEQQLFECFMECYRAFFPDGSPVTIDVATTQLCLAIKYNDEALRLITASLEEFGRTPARLYVHALVLLRLDRPQEARQALAEALALDPGYGPALRLLSSKFEPVEANSGLPYQHLRIAYSDTDVQARAIEIYNRSGVVLIDRMISPQLLADLQGAYGQTVKDWRSAGLGKPNNVGDKRFTVPIRIKPPFNDPALFANPVLLNLLTQVMGARPILNAFGGVMTLPGARMQHVHREHPLLFSADEANRNLPTYAVTVLLPLIDLDEESGGTQLWEGTHRIPGGEKWQGEPSVIYTEAGSTLTFDYRLYHGGMPCRAEHNRPMLFMSYSLPWFKDTLAFESHAALAISEQELKSIPDEHRDLFRFARRIEG